MKNNNKFIDIEILSAAVAAAAVAAVNHAWKYIYRNIQESTAATPI